MEEDQKIPDGDDQSVIPTNANKGKSCKGCLYYSSLMKTNHRNPLCVGVTRALPQVPGYMIGESEMEASKEGRSLSDFKYACVGYSVYLDKKDNPDGQPRDRAELPFCVGIEVNLKHKEDQYEFIWEIIDKRWDRQMHKPLHAAALYLNPGLYYEYEGIESNAEIKGGLFQVINILTSSLEHQEKVTSQLMQYRSSCGGFGLQVAVNARKVYAPDTPTFSPPRTYKPQNSIGDEFFSRFTRNASLVASGVTRNLYRVGNYIKDNVDDILYPYRRRPK